LCGVFSADEIVAHHLSIFPVRRAVVGHHLITVEKLVIVVKIEFDVKFGVVVLTAAKTEEKVLNGLNKQIYYLNILLQHPFNK